MQSRPKMKGSLKPTKDLIQSIRNRPCLWDKSCAGYKEKLTKDEAWMEIFREIDPSYDDMDETAKQQFGTHIMKKWYNVRDAYVKSLKIRPYRHRPYLYADALDFLDANYIIEHRTQEAEDDEEADDKSENWLNEVFVDIDENVNESDASKSSNPAKKQKLDYTNYNNSTLREVEGEDIVTVLAKLIEREEDEDRAFFKSITPIVKSLSNQKKLEFRIQVMKMLRSLKRSQKNSNIKSELISHDNSDEID